MTEEASLLTKIKKKIVTPLIATEAMLIGLLIILARITNGLVSIMIGGFAILMFCTFMNYHFPKKFLRFAQLLTILYILTLVIKSILVMYIGTPIMIIYFVWWQSKVSRTPPNGLALSCGADNFQVAENEPSSC